MKLLALPALLLFFFSAYCQTSMRQSGNIATFCKVWGFLKYHHPSVAKGKYDWDQAFTDNLAIIEQLETKAEANQFYDQWISGLGKLKPDAKRTPPKDAILSNYDMDWLKDTAVFTNRVSDLLLQVQNNTRGKNHYVKKKYFGLGPASFVNEKPYIDSLYPSKALRLLTLSRYWNIVNYFYPYKYLTDKKWNDVLIEFVPKFYAADDVETYHRTLLQLFAKLNDTHTSFTPWLYSPSSKTPPFDNKIIDDKVIVLNAFDDSICKKYDIRFGDIILAINGKSVKNTIDYYSTYVSASNYLSLCDQLTPRFLWSDIKDSAVISFEREGAVFEKVIPAYPNNLGYSALRAFRNQSRSTSNGYKVYDNNIAYVDLGKIKSKSEVKKVLESIKDTDAVVLDLRNYPNNSIFGPITNFFCTSRQPFAKFAKQSIKYPGALTWARTTYCGKDNSNPYQGKVAVLIDESAISFAEHFAMALKTIPGVTLVGSHTAGADGVIQHFVLPGNISAYFSDEAVFYPDGGETQRKGIVPDVMVTPTIAGIRAGKDEVLDKAIEIVSRK